MKTVLLIVVIVECLALLVLAAAKKLTKKVFFCLSGLTALLCGVVIVMNLGTKATDTVNQREQLYMAARLLQDERADVALQPLSLVEDAECEQYNVHQLRGLAYNMNSAFETAATYLEAQEDEVCQQIHDVSLEKEQAEEELVADVTEAALSALDFTEEDAARMEAELKLRYPTEEELAERMEEDDAEEEEEDEDTKTLLEEIEQAERDNDEEAAYKLMLESAGKGGLREHIVFSEMYLRRYQERMFRSDDAEYDGLLQNLTNALVEVNRTGAEEGAQDYVYGEEPSAEAKAYDQALAQYDLAEEELYLTAVKRSINYLNSVRPDGADRNIAYQLQLATLYYRANQRDEAIKCLDRIFAQNEIDEDQWLGLEARLLREAYIIYGDDSTTPDFDIVYDQLMGKLYMNTYFAVGNDFKNFLMDYFRDLLSGMRVNSVDYSGFPVVHATVASSELEITPQTVELVDTGETIKDFQVEVQEIDQLSICFVLDISGSMAGEPLINAKRAIEDSVLSLSDDTEIALVSFESEAEIDCGLTTSKYMVTGLLSGLQDRGGTNIAAGLRTGAEALQAAGGKKVIVLLSDGVDGSANEMPTVLDNLRNDDIVVYSVGLAGCDEAYLQNIANSTNGSFVMANDSSQLMKIYEEIQGYLVRTYYITYQVPESTREIRYIHLQDVNSLSQTKKTYRLVAPEIHNTQALAQQTSNFFQQIGGTQGRS